MVNNAPPPPQCRPKLPTVYFVASSDTSTNFLFGTFYLLGAQISADFYLSKVSLVSPAKVLICLQEMSETDWNSISQTKSSIIFCASQCNYAISRLQDLSQNTFTLTAVRDPIQFFRLQFSTSNVKVSFIFPLILL